jgi:preprotein translocase subunit SecF
VLAAILALIGYSLNDSIVVADRIRENFRNTRETDPEKIVNDAINEMLNRTINTSLTTALVLLALFFFGGEVMRSFSEALLVGIVVGTYSSHLRGRQPDLHPQRHQGRLPGRRKRRNRRNALKAVNS